ncbi:hypothetical protein BDV28DRAFT_69481 [Aspergillus coremiiformis]|uniref:Protein SQS1 n=1 Tax=Aspergillus coremiiformis TaxID=138285 RepID=A0A5N6YU95_9EURO|nr:hypothetical protein BDV28DRAFT_69481 [Aspergillus coremiiformis]
MQQEARNTENRDIWRPGSHLRHQGVQFVSAGNIQSDEETETEVPEAEESHNQSPTREAQPRGDLHNQKDRPATGSASFFIDLSGERPSDTKLADTTTTPSTPDWDGYSEDEIVFHGRRRIEARPCVIADEVQVPKAIKSDNPILNQPESSSGAEFSTPNSRMCSAADHDQTNQPSRRNLPGDGNNLHTKSGGPHSKEISWGPSANEYDDILADYIANMSENYYVDLPSQAADTKVDEPEHATGTPSQTPLTGADIPDLMDRLEKGSYPRRQPPLEREHNMISLLRLVPELADNECGMTVADDVDINPFNYATSASNRDSGSSQATNSDEEDIFDSDVDIEVGLEALRREAQGHPTRSQRSHTDSRNGFFAPVAAFADALELDQYYGFDIMDFNRPSLRKKQKGHARALGLVLLDSEPDNVWLNDREKKKARKQKREKLRSQGLLGRGAHDSDLKTKYSNGMRLGDLKTEIRTFLLSPRTSLALPPMTKHRRKLVHDLANALSLNSQSRGNGASRFPILHKTARTPRHMQKTISHIDGIFSRGRFSHGATKSWEQNITKSAKPRHGRPGSSVSYMDGDIVGASAPEIGAENKGRAMLEKMGWSTGTALGATNNKGILSPVAHVVKNSKAGLG